MKVLEMAGRGVHASNPAPALNLCQWCVDQIVAGDVLDDGPDPATVIHDGKAACTFHAMFYVGALGGLPVAAWGRKL